MTTTLNPGDIATIGVNTDHDDEARNDGFDAVELSMEGNTRVSLMGVVFDREDLGPLIG